MNPPESKSLEERAQELQDCVRRGCVESPCAACSRELETIAEALRHELDLAIAACLAEAEEHPLAAAACEGCADAIARLRDAPNHDHCDGAG